MTTNKITFSFAALTLATLVSLPAAALDVQDARATQDSQNTVVTQDSATDSLNDADRISTTRVNRVRINTQDQQPGQAGVDTQQGDTVERTEITQKEVTASAFRNEAVGIKPQFGLFSLSDGTGNSSTRAVGGMTIDMNFLGRANTDGGKPYFGPSIGILYSHLGSPGADFFGVNSPSGNNNGTHLLIMPVNAKLGYTLRDIARLSIHGGANLLYNNLSNNLNSSALSTDSSSFNAHPNLGFDIEFGLGKNLGVLIRPDWTFLNSGSVFTGTLGFDFPIT